MAVAFDAVGTGADGSAVNSLTWTHTPVGTPSAVGVWVGGYFNAADLSGATYGGTAMVPGTTYSFSGLASANAKSFGLASPASGAQTIVVSSSSGFISANSISVTGSDLTTCFSNSNGTTGNTVNSSVSVTSAVDEFVVDAICMFGNTTSLVPSGPGANQTIRYTDAWFGTITMAISSQPGAAGTVTATWADLHNSGQGWATVIDSFLAPSGVIPQVISFQNSSSWRAQDNVAY
jgi:hypothetical protein